MVKMIIGGEEMDGNIRSFARLEAAWPMIVEAKEVLSKKDEPGTMPLDLFSRFTPVIGVIAVALGLKTADGKPDIDAVKELLQADEVEALAPIFVDLLSDAKVSRP